MNKCGECLHAATVEGKPDFVRCNLRLPSWAATRNDNLAGNHLVLRGDTCSFYEHKLAYLHGVIKCC